MVLLETIQLRTDKESLAKLLAQFEKSGLLQSNPNLNVSTFCRTGIETVLAVHLSHSKSISGELPECAPSSSGLRLAAALKPYGLVEHCVWEQLK